MGSHLSSHRNAEQDARLLALLDDPSPSHSLAALAKALRKGANNRAAVYPGLPPSREPRNAVGRWKGGEGGGGTSSTPPAWTALMRAAYRGHRHLVAALLQHGAPLAFQADDGTSALMVAAQEGHVHVVQELLKHIKTTAPPVQPGAPPAAAAASPAVGLQQVQLQIAADDEGVGSSEPLAPRSAQSFHPILDAIDERGQTPLLKAAALGHGACMEALLRAGANVCAADHLDGMTALAWAAEHGPSRLVALCLQAGANINRKNHNGQTPLLCAASKDYDYSSLRDEQQLHAMHVLGGGQTNMDDPKSAVGGASATSGGVNGGGGGAAAELEESKSSASSYRGGGGGGGGGERPPWLESGFSPSSVVLTLLQNGGDANAANHDKYTALMVASWKGHSAVVELLIAHRANLDARAEKGQTALMLAAAQRHSRCAELLIAAGAALDVVDQVGHTALHKAAIHGDTHTVLCLLRAGADVSIKENLHGNSALLCAAQNLHSSIVELLLHPPSAASGAARPSSLPADPRARNHRGESALMLAAARGHIFTCSCLIKGGADLAAVDDAGNNALLLAARAGSDSVVELLLECAGVGDGAPSLSSLLSARNHAGHSALDLALVSANPAAAVELLVAAGAEPTDNSHAYLHPSSSSSASADGHAANGINGANGSSSANGASKAALEAMARGIAARGLYEQHERRYKDVVECLLEQQQQQQQSHPRTLSEASPRRASSAVLPSQSQSVPALDLPVAAQAASSSSSTPSAAQHQQQPRLSMHPHASNGSHGGGAGVLGPAPLVRHNSDLTATDSLSSGASASAAGAAAGSSSSSAAGTSSPPSSLSGASNANTRPLSEWSVAHVLSWLGGLGLSQYTQSFSEAAVDGEMLAELSRNEELLESELQVARKIHRIKMLREINKLVAASASSSGTAAAAAVAATTTSPTAAATSAALGASAAASSTGTAQPRVSNVAAVSPASEAAASSAPVPLTTSISNPLPAVPVGGSTSVTAAAAAASPAPSSAAAAAAKPAPPTSTSSLFPTRPAASGSSSLFPAAASASSASSAAGSGANASSNGPVAASSPSMVAIDGTASLDIFSSNFDFDNLSGLAPLSSSTGASSPAGAGSTAGNSAATSLVPSPSGSAGSLVPVTNGHVLASKQAATPALLRPSTAAGASVGVDAFSQEYSPMHQTDLVSHHSIDGAAQGRDSSNSVASSTPASTALASQQQQPRPTPRVLLPSSSQAHGPRRIPYSELTLREVIGQGQFGTVWLGAWRGAPVAIKKLHLEATVLAVAGVPVADAVAGGSGSGSGSCSKGEAVAAEQMGLFLQEASLHEQLGNHPNLVSFVGISLPDSPAAIAAAASSVPASAASQDGGMSISASDVCIVTTYFPLGSIRDLLLTRRTLHKLPSSMLCPSSPYAPVSLLTLLFLLRDIACGVHHLHLERCIHRDLAARNFLVDFASVVTHVGTATPLSSASAASSSAAASSTASLASSSANHQQGGSEQRRLAVRVADFGMSRLMRQAQAVASGKKANGAVEDENGAPMAGTGGSGADDPLPSAFTHSQVGPLKWMSPESILRSEYSTASDSYSFGVAVWEVVCGCGGGSGNSSATSSNGNAAQQYSEPYGAARPLEAAIKAAHDPSFRPLIPAHCPLPLARLMQHCWAHVPAERPAFRVILARLEHMIDFLRTKMAAAATAAVCSDDAVAAVFDAWDAQVWADFDETANNNGKALLL